MQSGICPVLKIDGVVQRFPKSARFLIFPSSGRSGLLMLICLPYTNISRPQTGKLTEIGWTKTRELTKLMRARISASIGARRL